MDSMSAYTSGVFRSTSRLSVSVLSKVHWLPYFRLMYCNTSHTSSAWISPGHTYQHTLVYLVLILFCVNGVPIIPPKI